MARRYPTSLSEGQRAMLRKVARGSFSPSGREQRRITRLVNQGLLVPAGSWYRFADALVEKVTFFVQEDHEHGPIKIGVAYTGDADAPKRIQHLHPRRTKILGYLEGDYAKAIRLACGKSHINTGWYHAHADVLAWTQRNDFIEVDSW